MSDGMQSLIYPVADLQKAKEVFGKLFGVEPEMDEPYYVGYKVGGQDIGLDPNGHKKGMTGPVPYWRVPDINAKIEELVAVGAKLDGPAKDVGAGNLIATLRDADGNPIGLIQPA